MSGLSQGNAEDKAGHGHDRRQATTRHEEPNTNDDNNHSKRKRKMTKHLNCDASKMNDVILLEDT